MGAAKLTCTVQHRDFRPPIAGSDNLDPAFVLPDDVIRSVVGIFKFQFATAGLKGFLDVPSRL
jgi:hypothetical protein